MAKKKKKTLTAAEARAADDARFRARRAAAFRSSSAAKGKPVRLGRTRDEIQDMGAPDRIRYYLGVPQGTMLNPALAAKALGRLKRDLKYDPDEGFGKQPGLLEEALWWDLQDAAEVVSERPEWMPDWFYAGPSDFAPLRSPGREAPVGWWDEERPPTPTWGPDTDPAADALEHGSGYKFRGLYPASRVFRHAGESPAEAQRRLAAQYEAHTEQAIDQGRYRDWVDRLVP